MYYMYNECMDLNFKGNSVNSEFICRYLYLYSEIKASKAVLNLNDETYLLKQNKEKSFISSYNVPDEHEFFWLRV